MTGTRMRWTAVSLIAFMLSMVHLASAAFADIATQVAPALPSSRGGTTSVWTGQYIYTFGGWRGSGYNESDYFDQIVRHDPATGEVKVSKAKLPGTRYLSAAVWDGTNAYIFGGGTLGSPYTQILRYSPTSETVTVMSARLPSPIYGLSAVYSGRYAYLFGGQSCSEFPCNYVGDVLRYDPQTDTLIDTGANIPARGFTSAAWDGTNAFVFGGFNASTRSNDILRYSPSSNTVTRVASLPSGRDDTSAASDGTYLYVFGGEILGGSPVIGEIVRFDPATNSVTTMTATIPPRRQSSAVWAGTKFVVHGGYAADIVDFRPASGWAGVPANLPLGRAGSSAVWDGNNAYIFGGVNGSRTDLVQRYEHSTGKISNMASVLPSPRSHTAAAWTGSDALIFGGITSTATDEILRFSPVVDTVTTVQAKLPTPLYGASAVWDGSNAYIFGGRYGNSYSDKIFRYDSASDQIATMTATLPTGRDGTAAVWDGSFAYIFGGSQTGQLFDDVLRYDPSTDTISTMAARLPRGSARFPAIAGSDGIYVFGGVYHTQQCPGDPCYNVTTYSNQIFRYRPELDELVTADATLPSPRADSAAVRVGNASLVIGGWDGSAYATKILIHRPIPGPASAFKVDPGPGGGQITISWQAPSPTSFSSPLSGYRLYVREGGSSIDTLLAEPAPGAATFVHAGLSNGAQRYYTLTAVNGIGEGLATTEAGTRAPVPPSAPPSLLGRTGPEAGSVSLTWTRPLDDGGAAISGYRIYRGSTQANMAAVADIGATTTYVDRGLQSSTYYYYKVASVNAAGAGTASVAINVRSSGPPGEPDDLQALPGVGGTSLSWAGPASNGGSAITAYRVYRRIGSNPASYIGATTATIPAYFDTGCRLGNLCYYTVTAVSAFGEGGPSNEAFMIGTRP